MGLKIDPGEILSYLNRMGYCNISSEQLEDFIKDLKKLIKYDMKHLKSSETQTSKIDSCISNVLLYNQEPSCSFGRSLERSQKVACINQETDLKNHIKYEIVELKSSDTPTLEMVSSISDVVVSNQEPSCSFGRSLERSQKVACMNQETDLKKLIKYEVLEFKSSGTQTMEMVSFISDIVMSNQKPSCSPGRSFERSQVVCLNQEPGCYASENDSYCPKMNPRRYADTNFLTRESHDSKSDPPDFTKKRHFNKGRKISHRESHESCNQSKGRKKTESHRIRPNSARERQDSTKEREKHDSRRKNIEYPRTRPDSARERRDSTKEREKHDSHRKKTDFPRTRPDSARERRDSTKEREKHDSHRKKTDSPRTRPDSARERRDSTKERENLDSHRKKTYFPRARPNSAREKQDSAKEKHESTKEKPQRVDRPASSFIKPRQLQAPAASVPRSNDPVSLYHKYQTMWKLQKIPGHDSRIGLRWNVREKMMGVDPQPRPVSRRATSTDGLPKQKPGIH